MSLIEVPPPGPWTEQRLAVWQNIQRVWADNDAQHDKIRELKTECIRIAGKVASLELRQKLKGASYGLTGGTIAAFLYQLAVWWFQNHK